MQVITLVDIMSNSSKQKQSLAHTKERFEDFVKYAPAQAVCKVVASTGDVWILEYKNNRFPCHKSKLREL